MRLILNAGCLIIVMLVFCSISVGEEKIPWENRHFPNAPRATAEQVLLWKQAGVKMVIVDIPWGKGNYNESHICGAISATVKTDVLDRLIKKIPNDYLIVSY